MVFLLSKDVLEEFKLECELRRLTPRTIKGYYNSTLLFLTWLERHHDIVDLETIRTQHIKMYIQYLIKKQLAIVCDYLGYEGISTHSFRKWYATEIYKSSGYDIALVQRLLHHSSAATTQRISASNPRRSKKPSKDTPCCCKCVGQLKLKAR